MKRNSALLVAMFSVAALIFSACTGKSSAHLSDVYAKMKAEVAFPTEMLKMDDDYFVMQFGFNPADFEEYVYAQGEDSLLAESIVLIKVKNGVNAGAVREKLEKYVSEQTTMFNSYIPEQGKVAGESVIVAKGSYVCMLMSSKVSELKKIVTEMI